jgi:hypothetical protein
VPAGSRSASSPRFFFIVPPSKIDQVVRQTPCRLGLAPRPPPVSHSGRWLTRAKAPCYNATALRSHLRRAPKGSSYGGLTKASATRPSSRDSGMHFSAAPRPGDNDLGCKRDLCLDRRVLGKSRMR